MSKKPKRKGLHKISGIIWDTVLIESDVPVHHEGVVIGSAQEFTAIPGGMRVTIAIDESLPSLTTANDEAAAMKMLEALTGENDNVEYEYEADEDDPDDDPEPA